MKAIDQYQVYELGAALHQLREVAGREAPSQATSFDQLHALMQAETYLTRLLHGAPIQISYCDGAVRALLGHMERAASHFQTGEGSTRAIDINKPPLQGWVWHAIRSGIEVFEHQFSAEVKKSPAYSVPERGIFSTERLVDHADRHIHETVRGSISAFALDEVKSAGRSLAFGLYSASGFHSARAVEDVLRTYCTQFLGDQGDIPMGLMAGRLNDLVTSPKTDKRKPKENTVRHLRDITSFDRNPLIHKSVVLEEMHAMTLFNSSLSVITEMVRELQEIATEEAFMQNELPLQEVQTAMPSPKRHKAARVLTTSSESGSAE